MSRQPMCIKCGVRPKRHADAGYCAECDDLLREQREAIRVELNIPKNFEGYCDACGDRARLVLDHDHRTGQFRGMLCQNCNLAAGMLKDSSKRALLLARYLRESEDM